MERHFSSCIKINRFYCNEPTKEQRLIARLASELEVIGVILQMLAKLAPESI